MEWAFYCGCTIMQMLVKNYRSADKDHGGDGATEANLVDYNVDLLLPSFTKNN